MQKTCRASDIVLKKSVSPLTLIMQWILVPYRLAWVFYMLLIFCVFSHTPQEFTQNSVRNILGKEGLCAETPCWWESELENERSGLSWQLLNWICMNLCWLIEWACVSIKMTTEDLSVCLFYIYAYCNLSAVTRRLKVHTGFFSQAEDHERWAMHFDSFQRRLPVQPPSSAELDMGSSLSHHRTPSQALSTAWEAMSSCGGDSMGRASVDTTQGFQPKARWAMTSQTLVLHIHNVYNVLWTSGDKIIQTVM